jgi:hypothetical protein
MPRMRARDRDFFADTLFVAAELAALRENPAAFGRLVVALAQANPEVPSPDRVTNRAAGAAA